MESWVGPRYKDTLYSGRKFPPDYVLAQNKGVVLYRGVIGMLWTLCCGDMTAKIGDMKRKNGPVALELEEQSMHDHWNVFGMFWTFIILNENVYVHSCLSTISHHWYCNNSHQEERFSHGLSQGSLCFTTRSSSCNSTVNIGAQKTITLLRAIPTMTFIRFVTGKSSGILSDISSGILSGISSGMLST